MTSHFVLGYLQCRIGLTFVCQALYITENLVALCVIGYPSREHSSWCKPIWWRGQWNASYVPFYMMASNVFLVKCVIISIQKTYLKRFWKFFTKMQDIFFRLSTIQKQWWVHIKVNLDLPSFAVFLYTVYESCNFQFWLCLMTKLLYFFFSLIRNIFLIFLTTLTLNIANSKHLFSKHNKQSSWSLIVTTRLFWN